MKSQELIDLLTKLDPSTDLYLEVDGKLLSLEKVNPGNFFGTAVLSSRVDFDITRAEQTLISCLQFQKENLPLVIDRIERAIGKERVERVITAFEEFQKKQEEANEVVEQNIELDYEGDMDSATAERILLNYYKGGGGDIEQVKEAKAVLGEAKSKEIFAQRNGN